VVEIITKIACGADSWLTAAYSVERKTGSSRRREREMRQQEEESDE
jgi:hypothetical protein